MKLPKEVTASFNYRKKPLKPYDTYDQKGRKVKIQPKKNSKHGLTHPLENDSTVYYELGDIVKNPTKVTVSTSNNPKAKANQLKGQVLIYEQEDFAKKLDIPGYKDLQGDITEVVILYDKTKKKNYSLTYHVKPK